MTDLTIRTTSKYSAAQIWKQNFETKCS